MLVRRGLMDNGHTWSNAWNTFVNIIQGKRPWEGTETCKRSWRPIKVKEGETHSTIKCDVPLPA